MEVDVEGEGKGGVSDSAIVAAVKVFLAGADLETVTVKSVRRAMSSEFGVPMDGERGRVIKRTVNAVLQGVGGGDEMDGFIEDDGGDDRPDEEDYFKRRDRIVAERAQAPPWPPLHIQMKEVPQMGGPGKQILVVRESQAIGFESRPWDEFGGADEDDEVAAKAKKHVNVVRWRVNPETGEKESNARLVEWEDGSRTLHVGREVLDVVVKSFPEPMTNFVYGVHKPWEYESKGGAEEEELERGDGPGEIYESLGILDGTMAIKAIPGSHTWKAITGKWKGSSKKDWEKTRTRFVDSSSENPEEIKRKLEQAKAEEIRAKEALRRKQVRQVDGYGVYSGGGGYGKRGRGGYWDARGDREEEDEDEEELNAGYLDEDSDEGSEDEARKRERVQRAKSGEGVAVREVPEPDGVPSRGAGVKRERDPEIGDERDEDDEDFLLGQRNAKYASIGDEEDTSKRGKKGHLVFDDDSE